MESQSLPAVAVPGARKKIWTYDADSRYWCLKDSREEIIRFELTAERHETFEGFLLPEHEEGDVHHLQNILQDIQHLHLEIKRGSNNSKWSNMFLQVIQTLEDPAPMLRQLVCRNFGRKLKTLTSSFQYLRYLRSLAILEDNEPLNHSYLAQAMKLGQLRNLETLVLFGTKLDNADCGIYASALQSGRVQGLSKIDFSGNRIFDSGAAALAHAFQSGHVKNLQHIDLSSNEIRDDGMVALASAFESGRVEGLKHVDFSENRISDSGAAALGRAFQSGHAKNLQQIKLQDNQIGDDGTVALASAFESGWVKDLNHIDFSGNRISDSGAAALGRAFQSGHVKNLQVINLRNNGIGDDGMVALGSAFGSGRNMQKLEEVNLGKNRIGDNGVVHLATALETGKLLSLDSLALDHNEIGITGINGLAKALEFGNINSLRSLDLSFNKISSNKELESLVQALSNKTFLILDIVTGSGPVDRRLKRQRELNEHHIKLLSVARNRKVPAKFGKVYLCGNPEVGKTTLRRSLERSKLRSLFMSETRKHVEPRTRGIDVCQMTSKGGRGGKKAISLALWDVAGQQDYHMVHNAFLRDLASSKANATIFVVMCSSLTDVSMAEKELENWFKFIASSVSPISPNHRDVFVVINRNDGDSKIIGEDISNEWKCLLDVQAKRFENYLKINRNPFIIDVRKRSQVQHFKETLIKRSEEILENVEVPEICDFIQNYLSDWVATREQFPVLPWIEVQSELRKRGANWPEESLQVAFKYLNEVGALIYVDKEFPDDWLIPKVQLVVANPTWLCKEILGSMFLPKGMRISTNRFFRSKVDPITGSILISDFKLYFRWSKNVEAANSLEKDQLLSILLWLGVCFLGHNENIIIPALISADNDKMKMVQRIWNQRDSSKDRKGQWIMGFSVEHVISRTALAPMALWHRFQVKLARIPKFNGNAGDENFVAGQYYVTFKVEYMVVLIQVNANETDQPSFESIEVLVKPLWNAKRDNVDINTRKQLQVDIAGDIVELLVDLWDEVCPGVGFIQRVVWPWPISTQRPKVVPEKNYEVAKLKVKLEEQDCWGQAIQANVGDDDVVTWDQLLSTSNKKRMKNYVSTLDIPKGKVNDRFEQSGSFHRLLFDRIDCFEEKVMTSLENISQMLRGFDQAFFEDKQSTCPKVMYVGEKNLSLCKQIKDLKAFPISSVHLHFLCEAFYDEKGHGVHVVVDQEGIDVSYLKHWVKKLAPWIKYSVLFLVTLAKISSNFVIPGLGLAIPGFIDWQQALSLSDGIIAVTGYTEKELDEMIVANIKGKGKSRLSSNPEELYGQSRKVMTDILGKLTAQEYMEKLRLLKVRLCNSDGSLIGVRWICYECLDKYRNAGHNVFEL